VEGAGVACCLALMASQAVAAEWPAESQNLWVEGQQGRGPGGGLSILLVSLWWLWVPLWAACSSWVAKDMGRWKLSPIVWPLAMVFPFFCLRWLPGGFHRQSPGWRSWAWPGLCPRLPM
jgi:hypothetical protein